MPHIGFYRAEAHVPARDVEGFLEIDGHIDDLALFKGWTRHREPLLVFGFLRDPLADGVRDRFRVRLRHATSAWLQDCDAESAEHEARVGDERGGVAGADGDCGSVVGVHPEGATAS